jgi:hypothetical protein
VGAAGDAEDLARGELPVLLVGAVAGALLERREHAAEGGEVLLLGHLAGLAQPLEEVAQAGPAGEPDRVDLDQVRERGVEEAEAAVLVEDREADRQVGEGLGQGLDEAAQARLGGDEFVDAGGVGQRLAARQGELGDLEPVRVAAERVGDLDAAAALAAVAGGERHLLEQVGEDVGRAVVDAARLGGREAVAVARVRPGHRAVGGEGPDQDRRAVERIALEGDVALGAGQRAFGGVEGAGLGARRADGEQDRGALWRAEHLVGGAVGAAAVAPEALAEKDEALEVVLDRGAVAGEVADQPLQRRAAAGSESAKQRAGRGGHRPHAGAVDEEVASRRVLGARQQRVGLAPGQEGRDERERQYRRDKGRPDGVGHLGQAGEERPVGEAEGGGIHWVRALVRDARRRAESV